MVTDSIFPLQGGARTDIFLTRLASHRGNEIKKVTNHYIRCHQERKKELKNGQYYQIIALSLNNRQLCIYLMVRWFSWEFKSQILNVKYQNRFILFSRLLWLYRFKWERYSSIQSMKCCEPLRFLRPQPPLIAERYYVKIFINY